MQLEVRSETWPIRGSFDISRGSKTQARVVVARLRDGDVAGRGECVPYARFDETVDAVCRQIQALASDFAAGLDRAGLQTRLPPGAARNALDCALWDLEAKRTGKRAWQLAGSDRLLPSISAYTLTLDSPAGMRANAARHAHLPLLKLKLAGPHDLERVKAVREGAPGARLIVDANEGWSAHDYTRLAPQLAELGVEAIEQPLPAGDDAALADLERPVPVCADESCHDRASLPALAGKYDMVNIKTDKAGGLTEALALKREAQAQGFEIMVGCMLATSLAMAPALIVAQGAALVDLDGPLLLERDRDYGLSYDHGLIGEPNARLWG